MSRVGSYLSVEALRNGLREQYAVRRSYGTVTVELELSSTGDRFLVSERITKPGVEATSTSTSHALLGMAHEEFERLVRKHP